MKLKKTLINALEKPIKAKQVWVMDKAGQKREFFGWYKVSSVSIIPAQKLGTKDEYLLLTIDTGIK